MTSGVNRANVAGSRTPPPKETGKATAKAKAPPPPRPAPPPAQVRTGFEPAAQAKASEVKKEKAKEKGLDRFQLALDGASMVPGVGAAASLVNAAVSSVRGNYGTAAIDLAAAVPFVGTGIKGAKLAKVAVKAAPRAGAAADVARAGKSGAAKAAAAAPAPKAESLKKAAEAARSDEVFDQMMTAAAKNGGKAPLHPELAFTTIPDGALASVMKNGVKSGRALGKAAGPNADAIWFKQGAPFYGEGITLVIPVKRLQQLGGQAGTGLAGQADIVKVAHDKLPGGIPFGEFAVVESVGRGFVKELHRPAKWKGAVGATLGALK
jgi:hypothetical protein